MHRYLFFLILISTPMFLRAQLQKKDVELLLTNGKSRDWRIDSVITSLGVGCIGTWQFYKFFSNGKVQRKVCMNGELTYTELSWKLVPVGGDNSGEWQLELDKPLSFKNGQSIQVMRIDWPLGKVSEPKQKMIWRQVPDCKACYQEEITLLSMN
jgi:hypothetical protein